MAKSLHNAIIGKTIPAIQSARFIAFTCDEVTSIDNRPWRSIHMYVGESFYRIPLQMALQRVVGVVTSDNLTYMLLISLAMYDGLEAKGIVGCFISFGVDGESMF